MKLPRPLRAAAERRARKEREARRAEVRTRTGRDAERLFPPDEPSAPKMPDVPSETPETPDEPAPVSWWVLIPLMLAAVVGPLLALTLGTSLVAVIPDQRWLLAGVTLPVLLLGLWWWRGDGRLPGHRFATALLVPLVAVALTGLGSTSSVVIDGRVVAATSEEAQVWRFARQLQLDLETLARYDELMRLGPPEARSRFLEYDDAISTMRRIEQRYATVSAGQLPVGELGTTVRTTAAAAFFGANALEARAQLVLTTDAVLENDLQTAHEAYVQQTLQAGQELNEIAGAYGLELQSTPEVAE